MQKHSTFSIKDNPKRIPIDLHELAWEKLPIFEARELEKHSERRLVSK